MGRAFRILENLCKLGQVNEAQGMADAWPGASRQASTAQVVTRMLGDAGGNNSHASTMSDRVTHLENQNKDVWSERNIVDSPF
jgi:hypothetical protein